MSTNSAIEWTEATWNPVAGCSVVSPGCKACYAMQMAARLEAMGQKKYAGLTKKANGHAVWTGKVNLDEKALTIPLSWKKPRRVFVNSMSDLFHPDVPFDYVDRVFAVMALCPQHTFQVLTKRPERMAEYTARTGKSIEFLEKPAREMGRTLRFETETETFGLTPWPLRNVWLGCSVEDQKRADERIPHLLGCPVTVRFLSCEPLLTGVDLSNWLVKYPEDEDGAPYPGGLDWVIVGGESGPHARPFDVLWPKSIVEQCRAAGVACFVKQLGSHPIVSDASDPHGWPTDNGPVNWETGMISLRDRKGGDPSEWPEYLRVREFPHPQHAAPR